MKCKICGQPATGSDDNWQCSANKYHYYTHRANQIRAAKQEWEKTIPKETRDILSAFRGDGARANFLTLHPLTHAVDG